MRSHWLSLAAFISGLGVLAVTGIFLSLKLQSVEPLNGAFGDQTMLAFELAETPSELARVIGKDPPTAQAAAVRQSMDHANRIDFIYMALYATLIASSCGALALARKRSWLWLGAILGPIAAGFDVTENLALLSLTRAGADVPALLAALHFRTYAKWELLALTSALFAAGFIGSRQWWVTLAAILVALIAAASGVLAYLNPASYIALLAYMIAAAWLWQLGYATVSIVGSSPERI